VSVSWKAVPVEQRRLEILLAPQIMGLSVTEVCRRFGVSRQQFYEWRRRYVEQGAPGLVDRSRRPLRSPLQVSVAMEHQICLMRADNPDFGPRRIRAEIGLLGGRPPATSTVQRVLIRNGLITPSPRTRRTWIRFERASPNELWQIDAIELSLADGTDVYAINLVDDHSRLLVASRATFVLDGDAAWDCFATAISVHGVPRELLSDNGRYFSGQHWELVAAFERQLWALGVKTIPITPGHPQTLGKLERLHGTMRRWLAKHPRPTTLVALQRQLDAFRWHYNEERPHQAINDQRPAERYRASPPATPTGEAQSRSVHRKVTSAGAVRYAGWRINLTTEWAGATVEVIESAGKVRIVYGDELISSFSTEEPRGFIGTGVRRGKRRIRRRVER
jgi:transposase InsO family protein